MKRVLTTLAILLSVLVAGMAALVLLVNPNDFRAYLIDRVEQRSGYQLTLDGDLRWHVWPQLSIIAGRMTLTAPGAEEALVSAENLRLDIKLWPLLSHQLDIRQVMLKDAVIRITPASKPQRKQGVPIAPEGGPVIDDDGTQWQFDIARLQLVDSLLIWQRADNEQINLRDINLTLDKQQQQQAQLVLSSRINRDQRDLTFSLVMALGLQHLPQKITAKITQFSYQLEGAGIPAHGIMGEGSVEAVYQVAPAQLDFDKLQLSANNNRIIGEGTLHFADVPSYLLALSAAELDLDQLVGHSRALSSSTDVPVTVTAAPVIANQAEDPLYNLQVLRYFNAQLGVKIDHLTFRGRKITQLWLSAENKRGLVTLNKFSGSVGNGSFALPAVIDVRGKKLLLAISPQLQKLELAEVLNMFELSSPLTGAFSMSGQLSGERGFSTDSDWQGELQFEMEKARLQNINLQQLIQQGVARYDNRVRGRDSYQRYTEIEQMSSQLNVNNGKITFNLKQASSPLLQVSGNGLIDVSERTCDMSLNIRVVEGWRGNGELVDQLIQTAIPLRIYGPWQQLSYQLQIESTLRKKLQDRVRQMLNKIAEKNRVFDDSSSLKRPINKP
ncbi:outer membrane assembly protein AsmA [Serratia microhaemolytica]|uniref:outer membrane assembly protein AsmA n=1 Tax=Serratia microhaemolytica TaxID=2675110 RepID=UPI000FDE7CC1|nr:outer membrane assembly protein AsmA [Serratia microhaemolytica]